MPTEHFRSRAAMRRNLAWRHLHGEPVTAEEICVKGEGCHKVQHSKNASRRRIDAAQWRKVAKRKYAHRNKKVVAKRR